MLRTALRPRWLALLAVVLVVSGAMAALGQWQLDRSRARGGAAQAEQGATRTAPVPLEQVIRPRTTFPKDGVGVRVVTTGRWDGARTLLVAGRAQAGREGYWVLVPLRRDDGSLVPVVRGWVAQPDDPTATSATDQQVTVTGLLQPSEPAAARRPGEPTGLPAGQIRYVSLPELATAWGDPMITGFVVQQEQSPATGAAPPPVPPPPPITGYNWRNLSYALQWWLFAGFGLFLWYRLVRDDHLVRLAPPGSLPGSPAGSPARDGSGPVDSVHP